MASTADIISIARQNIFETLCTFDTDRKVASRLAESLPAFSSDGKAYAIKLRFALKACGRLNRQDLSPAVTVFQDRLDQEVIAL